MASESKAFVKIGLANDECIEIETEINDTLSLCNVRAQVPNACGLKYTSTTSSSTTVWRGVRRVDDSFYPPFASGWGDIVYRVVLETNDTQQKVSCQDVSQEKNTSQKKSLQKTIRKDFTLGPPKAEVSIDDDNISSANIYTNSNLKPYEIAVNSAAQSLARDDTSLLLCRGDLYKKAKSKVKEDGYQFKKGYSRSGSSSDGKASDCSSSKKRKNIMANERQKAIENNKHLLKSTVDQIRLKEERINKLKNSRDFKKCDDVSSELRSLIKEKAVIESHLAALERKEAKSKWYKKKKSLKTGATMSKKDPLGSANVKKLNKITDLCNPKSKKDPASPESDGFGQSDDTLILDDDDLDTTKPLSQQQYSIESGQQLEMSPDFVSKQDSDCSHHKHLAGNLEEEKKHSEQIQVDEDLDNFQKTPLGME